jgi:hypothetical protein
VSFSTDSIHIEQGYGKKVIKRKSLKNTKKIDKIPGQGSKR